MTSGIRQADRMRTLGAAQKGHTCRKGRCAEENDAIVTAGGSGNQADLKRLARIIAAAAVYITPRMFS
jgi:hypothetical protein